MNIHKNYEKNIPKFILEKQNQNGDLAPVIKN